MSPGYEYNIVEGEYNVIVISKTEALGIIGNAHVFKPSQHPVL